MTYENFRVGLTRLFIFLTILIEIDLFLFTSNRIVVEIFDFGFSQSDGFTMERFDTTTVMMTTPFLMVGLFYICCWIVKGFYFGKGNQKV